jgi:hypothetical protein
MLLQRRAKSTSKHLRLRLLKRLRPKRGGKKTKQRRRSQAQPEPKGREPSVQTLIKWGQYNRDPHWLERQQNLILTFAPEVHAPKLTPIPKGTRELYIRKAFSNAVEQRRKFRDFRAGWTAAMMRNKLISVKWKPSKTRRALISASLTRPPIPRMVMALGQAPTTYASTRSYALGPPSTLWGSITPMTRRSIMTSLEN